MARNMNKTNTDHHIPSMTDLGRAERMVAQNRQTIRYNYAMKSWYIWDGKVWGQDKAGNIQQVAKKTIKSLYKTVLPNIEDSDKKRKFMNELLKAENQNSLRAMIESAENEKGMPIDITEFDSHKGVISVANGIIDLLTGKLIPHERKMYLTKMISFNYNPDATCQKWMDFLETTFPESEEMIKFVQRAFGYILSGYTSEQVFFIFYGHGSNGKGVMIDTITRVMEEFATTTQPDTIIRKRYERSSTNDLADLWGARFVSTSETDSYQELDEGRIKRITGQDPIKCRFLYKEWFEYIPEYKLVLITNHEPIIKAQDYSIWRRVLKIPFNNQIPKENWNLTLREELYEEREGILKWMVDGAVEWFENGLQIPEEVAKATEEYKDELDIIGDFLDACVTSERKLVETNQELYKCYKWWCEKTENRAFSNQAFARSVTERGYTNTKQNGVRVKVGMGIKENIKKAMQIERYETTGYESLDAFEMSPDADKGDQNDNGGRIGRFEKNNKKKTASVDGRTDKCDFSESAIGKVIYGNSTKTGVYPSTSVPDSDKNEITVPDSENSIQKWTRWSPVVENAARIIVEWQQNLYPVGNVGDLEKFACMVFEGNYEVQKIMIDDFISLTRRLSANGWKV